MKLLDRYVFLEWLKVFVMGMCSMLGLLVVIQMAATVKKFQDTASSSEIGMYYLWQIPEMLPIVLPVTLLVTLLFTLGNMHKNQEITAMRAAGLSLWRITRTFWGVGFVCVAALLVVNTMVIPVSLRATRTFEETMDFRANNKTADGAARSGAYAVVFDNGRDNRRWRVASLGGYTNEALGVQVFELDSGGAPIRRIDAKRARFDTAKGFWIFEQGRVSSYSAEGSIAGDQPSFAVREFPNYTEKPLFMQLMTKKPTNLSFGEIGTLLSLSGDFESAKTAALEVRYQSILAWPFSCLVVIAMAIPFAVAGVRTNPMVGVSKSIAVFALYYLCDKVGYALGSQQVLPAMLAAWLPNLAALAYAIPLCSKVN